MRPKVSVSLTKKQFLFIQENFHASKSFWKIYPLKKTRSNKQDELHTDIHMNTLYSNPGAAPASVTW